MKKILIFVFLLFSMLSADNPKFALKIKGNQIVINDSSEARFFLAGMVSNNPQSGEQLSAFDSTQWRLLLKKTKEIKANTVRWNAFLFGKDITFDENGLASGLYQNSLSNFKKALDMAYEEKVLVQVVLTTAHFLNFGWGGESKEYNGLSNSKRVSNNLKMFSTDEGIQAYIDNVITPITDTVGIHPALFGFCISNEAYGMTESEKFGNGWSDSLVTEANFARFANKVSGELHRKLSGVICSISSIAKKSSIYNTETLIRAGNDPDGVLDIYQYQYYPENHTDADSPFLNDIETLSKTAKLENDKPSIAGEFWMHGITDKSKKNILLTPTEAYQALWDNGLSGGFTWSDYHYFNVNKSQWNEETIASIDSGYINFYENNLKGLDPFTVFENESSVNEDLINKYEVMAFPNPFANNLSVTYSLEETAEVAISVVDVTGQAISVIENDTKNAGNYIAKYNNANLPKGIYFVKFMINGKTFIKEVFCTK